MNFIIIITLILFVIVEAFADTSCKKDEVCNRLSKYPEDQCTLLTKETSDKKSGYWDKKKIHRTKKIPLYQNVVQFGFDSHGLTSLIIQLNDHSTITVFVSPRFDETISVYMEIHNRDQLQPPGTMMTFPHYNLKDIWYSLVISDDVDNTLYIFVDSLKTHINTSTTMNCPNCFYVFQPEKAYYYFETDDNRSVQVPCSSAGLIVNSKTGKLISFEDPSPNKMLAQSKKIADWLKITNREKFAIKTDTSSTLPTYINSAGEPKPYQEMQPLKCFHIRNIRKHRNKMGGYFPIILIHESGFQNFSITYNVSLFAEGKKEQFMIVEEGIETKGFIINTKILKKQDNGSNFIEVNSTQILLHKFSYGNEIVERAALGFTPFKIFYDIKFGKRIPRHFMISYDIKAFDFSEDLRYEFYNERIGDLIELGNGFATMMESIISHTKSVEPILEPIIDDYLYNLPDEIVLKKALKKAKRKFQDEILKNASKSLYIKHMKKNRDGMGGYFPIILIHSSPRSYYEIRFNISFYADGKEEHLNISQKLKRNETGYYHLCQIIFENQWHLPEVISIEAPDSSSVSDVGNGERSVLGFIPFKIYYAMGFSRNLFSDNMVSQKINVYTYSESRRYKSLNRSLGDLIELGGGFATIMNSKITLIGDVKRIFETVIDDDLYNLPNEEELKLAVEDEMNKKVEMRMADVDIVISETNNVDMLNSTIFDEDKSNKSTSVPGLE